MTIARTRAGFFERTEANTQSVWVSHAGTNQDFYMTLSTAALDKAVGDGKDHPVGQMYGMGVLKEINDVTNLYAFDAVIDGYLVTLVMSYDEISKAANKIEAVNV